VRGNECLQFACDQGVPTQREQRLGPQLQGADTEVLQPGDLGPYQVGVDDVTVRRPGPQPVGPFGQGERQLGLAGCKRVVGLVDECCEPLGVDAGGRHHQRITGA
jgi:hypothetical protein